MFMVLCLFVCLYIADMTKGSKQLRVVEDSPFPPNVVLMPSSSVSISRDIGLTDRTC